MNILFSFLLSLIPFYLLGCFPTGTLIARLYGVDIGKKGSGNVGATNVARVIGKKAGLFTLLGDVVKGALAVCIASTLFHSTGESALAGLAAVAGHCLSIPPLLKGGKGVATSLGVVPILSPFLALVGVSTFVILFFLFRYVSLASVGALILTPVVAWQMAQYEPILFALIGCALLVVWRHRENLKRLLRGTEPQFNIRS